MSTLEIQQIESKINSKREHYGKFIFWPLKNGQGLTVGNALRRILLSDIKGTAITSAKISGVVHEYSEIPGVREDVQEILLNLKEIVLKGQTTTCTTARLKVEGPCIVKASHLEFPSFIEPVDPDQYIATICDSHILEIEVSICTDCGYRIGDKQSLNSIGNLQLDPVFMPVNKVGYTVDDINKDFYPEEKLTLEVWTNGSLTPEECMQKAAAILTEILKPITYIHSVEEREEEPIKNIHLLKEREEEPTRKTKKFIAENFPIEHLNLSARAYHCLKQKNIHSTEELLKHSQEELLSIRSFGKKSCEEINKRLNDVLGLKLRKKNFK